MCTCCCCLILCRGFKMCTFLRAWIWGLIFVCLNVDYESSCHFPIVCSWIKLLFIVHRILKPFFCHHVVFSDFCASEKELKFPFREIRNVGRCPSSLALKTKKELPASMVLDLCLFSECQTARQVYLNTFLVLLVNIELSVFLSGCHLISGRKGVN